MARMSLASVLSCGSASTRPAPGPEQPFRDQGTAGNGTLKVSPVDPPGSDWDAFLKGQAESTFARLSAWREIIPVAMGHEPVYLAARDGAGRLAGVLPLFALRSQFFGRRLVSGPLLSYGGPVGSGAAVATLVDAAVAEGRRRRVRAVELRARTEVSSSLRSTARKVTALLPLHAGPAPAPLPAHLRGLRRRRGLRRGLSPGHAGNSRRRLRLP